METHENAEPQDNRERESIIQQLDEIDGIGRKTAEAMYQIGIHSYADLAIFLDQHTTAREISEAFKERGINLPAGLIHREKWISSLSSLQEQAPALQPVEEMPSSLSRRDHEFEFTVFFDVMRDQDGRPVLQTTVYNPKDAGEEKDFEGNDPQPWVNWMLVRVNPPFTLAPMASRAEVYVPPVPGTPVEARLEISGVQISIVEPLAKIPEKRLGAEINFRLSGAGAEALVSQNIPVLIEMYTIDLEKGVQESLASIKNQLEPHQFEYTFPVEFAFPEVGRYGILSLIRLHPPVELSAFHWGPVIRVTP